MTDIKSSAAYGQLIEPTTLKIQRVLPGPIERVWSYLTESDLRRQWLAAGKMDATPGAAFELIWRNDELTDPPGRKPDGFGEEHRMKSRVLAADAPRKLAFTWGEAGDVTITLEPKGKDVLLTLVHRRLDEAKSRWMVGAGWHSHLDVLASRVGGSAPEPFWDKWTRLRAEYEGRMPA